VDLCHQYGIVVMVDGAHTLGNIPLDIGQIDADFYLTNAHKWLYSPKGSAILWVKKQYQKDVVPTVISSVGLESYQDMFQYTGTRNYNAMLAISAALDFVEQLGKTQINEYIKDLAWNGANALKDLWKTELLIPKEMATAIVNVKVPTQNMTVMALVQAEMQLIHNTYVQTSVYNGAGIMRLSGQIYLEMADIILAGHRMLALFKKYEPVNALPGNI